VFELYKHIAVCEVYMVYLKTKLKATVGTMGHACSRYTRGEGDHVKDVDVRGKGSVYPRTGNEGPEGE
jgi:hypothetical protein